MEVRLADVVDLNRTQLPLDLYDARTLPYGDRCFDTVTVLAHAPPLHGSGCLPKQRFFILSPR
ncbi:MAG: hypothetical protein JJU00_06795 [Opitutales bacterium]|nr:hypothetical protein [Opitutales bacterium]